jgi:NodT family efflux transporter outer membrane factor (OMF) lipoprotein
MMSCFSVGRQKVFGIVLIALATICVVAGCMVGPDYHAPVQSMPARWVSGPTTQGSITVQEPIKIDNWWTTFGDPELDSLIRRAVASNLSLEAAVERVRQARATVGSIRATLFPAASVNGAYSRSGTGTSPSVDNWSDGLDAAWEIDVFGGTRRAVESANASLDASVEDRRDVMVTLLGEVATDYILLRGFQQEIVIAEENLQVQIRSESVTRDKQKLGTGTELDIVQSDAIVSSTRADLETQHANEQQAVYALSILLALPPAALLDELSPVGKIPDPPPVLPVGLPAELLRRRPDIRRSERELAAANALIGVATADLYPKFTLGGNLSFGGNNFPNLFAWNDRSWSVGPSASWLIFSAGQIDANIEIQNAATAQAFTTYKATVLTALQEVENGLVAYAREQQRRVFLADTVAANQRAVVLSTRRYNQGLNDFLSVLDAERSLFASQDALVQSDRNIASDAVALYKALGGGWESGEALSATRPAN